MNIKNVPVGDLGGLLLGAGTGFRTEGGAVNLGKTFKGSMPSLTVYSTIPAVLLGTVMSSICRGSSGQSKSKGTSPSLNGGANVATFQKQPSGMTAIT
jgi:hypothetical protein